MSRYCGNDEKCDTCGVTYGAFRTGFSWGDIWLMFWTPDDAPPGDWVRKNRGRILGRWFEIKQDMWAHHIKECAKQRAYERGTEACR